MARHKKGNVLATKIVPLELNFYFAINDKYKAFEFEKYLKSGSGRALLINISQLNSDPETAKSECNKEKDSIAPTL